MLTEPLAKSKDSVIYGEKKKHILFGEANDLNKVKKDS